MGVVFGSLAADPDVGNTNGTRPTIRYAYDSAGPAINDRFELGANLRSVTEPADDAPRVTYKYGTGSERDKVVRQQWTATGESATFSYPTPIHTDVEDALKQRREYTLSSGPLDYNSGVYDLINLRLAQASRIFLFWSHDLEKLTAWIETTRP